MNHWRLLRTYDRYFHVNQTDITQYPSAASATVSSKYFIHILTTVPRVGIIKFIWLLDSSQHFIQQRVADGPNDEHVARLTDPR